MRTIRYGVHFTALAVAAALLWSARNYHVPQSVSNFDFSQLALAGALHSTSVVVALRGRRAILRDLAFIVLATVLSVATPFLGLFGSVVWRPLAEALPKGDFAGYAIFATGSAIGASGYWLLAQQLLGRTPQRRDWLRSVGFCVTATCLVLRIPILGYDWGIADRDHPLYLLTTAWWVAFSTSMYVSEGSPEAKVAGKVRLALRSAAWLSALFVVWSHAVLLLSPLDSLTMTLPRRVRKAVAKELIAGAHFDAKDFPTASRAVRLDPANDDAWTAFCAAGVRDGKDMGGALAACAHAAETTRGGFHAELIAEAYRAAQQPCAGLPVLRKTMGEETTSNISPIFSVGRLEAECGEMEEAERHLRSVVELRQKDLRDFNWLTPGGGLNSIQISAGRSLSEALQNLSALLTMRHKDDEALRVCRAALGTELKRCTCHFAPNEGVACDTSYSR